MSEKIQSQFQFTISVAAELFEGYDIVVPYPLWKRLGDDVDMPVMEHEARVAAFERYEREHGPQAYYLEEEFDEDAEENDDYDPYLWIRPWGETPEEHWYRIELEDAVRWTEHRIGEDYNLVVDSKITKDVLSSSVEAFCANPFWKRLYDGASPLARRYLALVFLESDNGDLVQGNEEEFEDEFAGAADKLKVSDWEYLIAECRGHGGAASLSVREFEKRLALARERETLKATSVTRCLRELKAAFKDWEAGRTGDEQYTEIAHRCRSTVERLEAIGRVSESAWDRFESVYTTYMYLVND